MEKVIWSDRSLDQSPTMRKFAPERTRERGGLDAARGLLFGLAISQVFWLVLAGCVMRFWIHKF